MPQLLTAKHMVAIPDICCQLPVQMRECQVPQAFCAGPCQKCKLLSLHVMFAICSSYDIGSFSWLACRP